MEFFTVADNGNGSHPSPTKTVHVVTNQQTPASYSTQPPVALPGGTDEEYERF